MIGAPLRDVKVEEPRLHDLWILGILRDTLNYSFEARKIYAFL